jgi:UDP-N-acetylglucosamine diphosphorylase/glucosamine-1-phosphate N-acetyltransferase
MNYILFEDKITRADLLPLTSTRPIADLRFGILTIREKWEYFLKSKTSTLTEKFLANKFPIVKGKENILINASVVPDDKLVNAIENLKADSALVWDDRILAMHLKFADVEEMNIEDDSHELIEYNGDITKVYYAWDLFSKLEEQIINDIKILTKGKKTQPISASNNVIGKENIFIEEGAKVEMAMLNATNGPIYIGKNAEIMEGAAIRGPFALGENAVIKMNAKIYGPTSIGPFSKVGGEVNNSMIFGYSNKAHDGFIGNSVIGEWCNLGADTNVSNLKNTYDKARAWNYNDETFIDTDLQFLGLIMGDHCKTAINTQINTATTIGVNTNIFGTGFPRNFIPSFSWGGASGFRKYNLKKAMEVAETVMARRNVEFTEEDKAIFAHIFKLNS